jgi:transposase
MPRRRLSVRTIREVLRLRWQSVLSEREIGASCHISATAVRSYLQRAKDAGLSWPLPEDLNDTQLEQRLFPPPSRAGGGDRPAINWAEVNKQMKRKGVTLHVLWEEHRQNHPNGYCYSRYCKLYAAWLRTSPDPVMIQEHKAGDKLFVDYAGQTMPITDPKTGEVTDAQIFVAALGSSNYTFAEATLTQSLPDWIGSHIRCFAFLGGVPRIVVPDNLKSGVTSPSRYEPDINPTYLKLANHYGVAVVPARVRRPRDKAKAENAVLQVERRILARLRNHTFHTLAALNEAIAALLSVHNEEVTKSLGSSRKVLFETIDLPELRPLPEQPFEEGAWSKARVNVDYHVVIENHRYSVPYELCGRTVDVHVSASVVEIFVDNVRVASHMRSNAQYRFTTVKAHMPANHQYVQWRGKEFLDQACQHGPNTVQLIGLVLKSRPVPEQTYRSCQGILRLATEHGSECMEAAALRAVVIQMASYKGVKAILENDKDKLPLPIVQPDAAPIIHDNIRGEVYFGEKPAEEADNA